MSCPMDCHDCGVPDKEFAARIRRETLDAAQAALLRLREPIWHAEVLVFDRLRKEGGGPNELRETIDRMLEEET